MDFLTACDKKISPYEDILKHSNNVAEISIKIYDNLPLMFRSNICPVKSDLYEDKEIVRLCGLYHDMGKIYINETYPDMLNKPKFDETDRKRMYEHMIMGAEIIQQLSLMCDADKTLVSYLIQTCLLHHERLNGKGYFGITQIPKIAQLVACADIYSAGLEKRVYEDVKKRDRLREEMYSQAINQIYVDALFLKQEN
jgi:putative nucleotidyltransferase with HDIG domain